MGIQSSNIDIKPKRDRVPYPTGNFPQKIHNFTAEWIKISCIWYNTGFKIIWTIFRIHLNRTRCTSKCWKILFPSSEMKWVESGSWNTKSFNFFYIIPPICELTKRRSLSNCKTSIVRYNWTVGKYWAPTDLHSEQNSSNLYKKQSIAAVLISHNKFSLMACIFSTINK